MTLPGRILNRLRRTCPQAAESDCLCGLLLYALWLPVCGGFPQSYDAAVVSSLPEVLYISQYSMCTL